MTDPTTHRLLVEAIIRAAESVVENGCLCEGADGCVNCGDIEALDQALCDFKRGVPESGFAASVAWHREQREARGEPSEESVSNYASCPSHCCKVHGCKYGFDGCPVVSGRVERERGQCQNGWDQGDRPEACDTSPAPTALTKERELLGLLAAAKPGRMETKTISESGHRIEEWARIYFGDDWSFELDDGDPRYLARAKVIVAAVNSLPSLLTALDASRTALAEAERERDEQSKMADEMLAAVQARRKNPYAGLSSEVSRLTARLAEAEERLSLSLRAWESAGVKDAAALVAVAREAEERARAAEADAADTQQKLDEAREFHFATEAARDAALADAARKAAAIEAVLHGPSGDWYGAVALCRAALSASPSTAWLEAKVREARAAALREAADWVRNELECHPKSLAARLEVTTTLDEELAAVRSWLLSHAASIEAGTTGEP
jgi:hypothetical protein